MSATAEQPVAARPPALQNVPPFPPVAARLMRLVSDDDFSYKDVADLIRADAAFSVEVLRLANSSVFGFRYEIKDIPHAIAVLGLNRLRAIVMTLAMKDFLVNARQHEALQRTWRHNLACALSCELLSKAFWVDSGLAYTAGLLHDVGMLAMVTTHIEEYSELVQLRTLDPASFLQRERELLGIDHCEAGRWLLMDWGLPPEFTEAAARHHDAQQPADAEITSVVQLGCATATLAGFSVCDTLQEWDQELVLSQLPENSREKFRAELEDFPLTIATKINSFDCDFFT